MGAVVGFGAVLVDVGQQGLGDLAEVLGHQRLRVADEVAFVVVAAGEGHPDRQLLDEVLEDPHVLRADQAAGDGVSGVGQFGGDGFVGEGVARSELAGVGEAFAGFFAEMWSWLDR